MIYVLMSFIPGDYDSDPQLVYASPSLTKVEQKHADLLAARTKEKRLREHAMELDNAYAATHFPPTPPNLAELPISPLVWNLVSNKWENAYLAEWDKKVAEYQGLLNLNREKILEELSAYYQLSKEDFDNIWYGREYDYYVETVESD